jgi:hypothetical protein
MTIEMVGNGSGKRQDTGIPTPEPLFDDAWRIKQEAEVV